MLCAIASVAEGEQHKQHYHLAWFSHSSAINHFIAGAVFPSSSLSHMQVHVGFDWLSVQLGVIFMSSCKADTALQAEPNPCLQALESSGESIAI